MIIRDQSGCRTIFGGVFVLSGTFVLAFLLFGGEVTSFWQGAAVGVIGVAHLAGGVWLMKQTPPRRVEIDVVRKELVIRTRSARGTRTQTYLANELAGGRIVEDRDSDGDPIFTAEIMTKTSQWIPLTSTPRNSREGAERDLQLVYTNLFEEK